MGFYMGYRLLVGLILFCGTSSAYLSRGQLASSRTSGDAGSAGGEGQNCAELISAEMTDVPTGHRFVIRFRENAGDLQALAYDYGAAPRVVEVEEDDSGISTAEFVVENREETNLTPYFMLGDSHFSNVVLLRLDNSLTGPVSQDIASLPAVQFNTRDITYTPGQDTAITAIIPLNNGVTLDRISGAHNRFAGIDLNTRVFNPSTPWETIFQMGQRETTPSYIQTTGTLLTSLDISGIYTSQVDVSVTGGPLVTQIEISNAIPVHPSNQDGVFPPGYLTFDNYPRPTSQEGHELHTCTVGLECTADCTALGNTLTDVVVRKVNHDNSLTAVHTQVSPLSFGFSRTVFWEIPAENSGTATFQCEARDHAHNATLTKLIDVRIMTEFEAFWANLG